VRSHHAGGVEVRETVLCRAKIRPAASRKLGPIFQAWRSLFATYSGGRSPCGVAARAAQPEKYPWLTQLLACKPFRVVAVALANKMARIAWALLAKGGTYRAPAVAA
jgi:hypothetical protein